MVNESDDEKSSGDEKHIDCVPMEFHIEVVHKLVKKLTELEIRVNLIMAVVFFLFTVYFFGKYNK